MDRHDLVQGSAAWLAHRAQCWNASDAPAMMGCSPYETRAALIRRIATGITPDVDAGTRRLFDDGHRFETLARPGAEVIVGDDLSPLSGSIDIGLTRPLAASFDGLTFMHDVNWEHKSLNDALRAVLPATGIGDESVGAQLPMNNRVQLEQQMAVSGAERSLFTASKWQGDTLLEARHCWYVSDPALRAQILAGWAQLEKDVAGYVPQETPAPAQPEAMESLPAVSVRLDGALSVAGNLPTFAEALKAFIAKIPAKPATDSEFATVDAACKALKKAEETLDAAEAGALASITDVEAMRRAVADCRKLARDTRLAAEKLVERRKVEMKEQAVMAARRALAEHVDALSAELAPVRLQMPAVDFALAIKGLRSIASMQDALDTELANGKIAADAQARVIRTNRAALDAAEAGHLFPDFQQVCTKPAEDFANLIVSRQAAARQRIEAERERIRAEEAARLEREQRAEAERKARADAEAKAAAERAAQAQQQEIVKPALAGDSAAAPSLAASVGNGETPAPCHREAPPSAPAPEVRAFTAPAVAELPTLKLGELWDVLGLTDREAFLAGLGFPATPAPKGTGKLYLASKLPDICIAISQHFAALAGEAKKAA